MNICNFLMERLSQKRTRQPRKAKRVVSGHGSLTSGFQGNITERKRHSRCNQFISFTRLTFTSILSYKKKKRNELTLMKNENIKKKKSLKLIVQFFCSSRSHVHVGVHPLFISDFIYISLFQL